MVHSLVLVEKTDDAEETTRTGEISCENISAACDGKNLNRIKRFTNADLKISQYLPIEIIPWKFCFLNPKDFRVVYPWNLPAKFAFFLKSRQLFNLIHCFGMFVNKYFACLESANLWFTIFSCEERYINIFLYVLVYLNSCYWIGRKPNWEFFFLTALV